MDQQNAPSGQDTAADNNKEADTEELSMEALLETGELTLDLPRPGDVRQGVIASVSEDEVLVSIGAKSEGVIPAREISQLSEEDREALKVGEKVNVFVVSPESRQGTLILSVTRALEEGDWIQAEDLMKSKEILESKIEGFNKGGLIVKLGRLRGFVPASQVSLSRRMSYKGDTPEQRWSDMVDDPIFVRVIEVDRQRRRLIFSEKAASSESRETLKERLLEEIHVGDVRKGRVTSLADFGAFVNINGADGLVHLSEISWERIENPKEVLEVGQEVEVKIISIDQERKRIGLSIRQLQKDPWGDLVASYTVGQLVEGEVTRLTKFGAFAKIDENIEGLIHVSELSDKRIEHPREVLAEGDKLTLRIIKVDTDRRRIGLSLRKVESMKYSEMDWELALAEIEGVEMADEVEGFDEVMEEMLEGGAPPAEAQPEAEEAEAAAEEEAPESSEAEEAEAAAEEEAPEAREASAEQEAPEAAEMPEKPQEETPEEAAEAIAEEPAEEPQADAPEPDAEEPEDEAPEEE